MVSTTGLVNAALPDDLLAEVFLHVAADAAGKADLDSCALVCRRWCAVERASRRAARVPVDGPDGDVVVRCVAERFPGLTDVFLDHGLYIAAGASAAAAERSKAQGWDNERRRSDENHIQCSASSEDMQEEDDSDGVNPTSFTDAGLLHLIEGCKGLEKLTLNWFLHISEKGLVGIANRCRNLQSLALSGGSVQNHGLITLAEGCNISELKLCGVQELTDEGLVEFVKIRSKSLVSLDISFCNGCITDRSLDAIGTYCHNLEVLSVESKHVKVNNGIISVAKGCQCLKSLKMVWLGVGDEALEAIGSSCSALENLSLDNLDKCSNRSLFSIANGCKQLKSLIIKSSVKFTDRSIERVSQNCKMLQHMEINMCHIVETAALEHIGQRCINLLGLTLNCLWIENNAFLGFGRCCSLLKSVCLANCCKISDEAISHIAQGCKNMRELSIISCPQIGDEALLSVGENCKELKELTLHGLGRLNDTGLATVDQCCFLEKLDICGCKQITDYGLTTIIRECHDLVHLDISDTKKIGDTTLAKVGEGFPKLKHLMMLRCDAISDVGLADIARGCLQLEECGVFRCSQVTPAGVATLAGGSSRLQRIIVEKCKVPEEATGKCRMINDPILISYY
uniref:F-box/LRR-repeat protein 15-like leucin rich repeat domain-containing protein n=1 Tax=Oryza punctata TaxID=4537 RepID=A0A0E0M5I0_ORYPU